MSVKLTKECYGEDPKTEFKNNLEAVNVQLIDYQDFYHLLDYLPNFVRATYSQSWNADFELEERLAIVRDAFMGRSLPTALETVGLTFIIDGIDLTTVTHLIRHRSGSFSADCSAEKWWHEKDALVPSSIENSGYCIGCGSGVMCGSEPGKDGCCRDDFYSRYKSIVEMSKQLYCDMIDSKQISIMDARSILPRCLSTYYFVHMPLNAVIAFIKQRADRQIQPEVDNIIAYQMYLEILKVFPLSNGIVNIDAQDKAYLVLKDKQGPMFKPEKKNDVWMHTDDEFLYPKLRSEMSGTNRQPSRFEELYVQYSALIKYQMEENNKFLVENFGLTTDQIDKIEVQLK